MGKLSKFLEKKGLFWAVAFLLFFIPVYPKFPLLAVPGTYVAVRLEDLLVALVIGLWAVRKLWSSKRDFWRDTLSQLFALYFLAGGLSVISALFVTKNVTPHIAFLHFLRRVEYMTLFFVAYDALRRVKDIWTWAAGLGLATTAIFIYGMGQKFLGWPVVSTMNKEFSKGLILQLTWWARVNSTFAGHYDLAAFLVIILCLTFAFIIATKKWRVRIIGLLLALAAYYLLILTASRISFAAYILAITFLLITLGKKWWVGPVLALSLGGMLLSADISQRYASTFNIDLGFLSGLVKVKPAELALGPTLTLTPIPKPKLTGPMARRPGVKPEPTATPTPTPTPLPPSGPVEPTEMAVARSTDIRLKVEWPRAIRAFAKNPILGTGYSSITLATDNDYLRMLGETGLLGTFAFLVIFVEIGRKVFVFWQRSKPGFKRAVVLGICSAAFGFFLNAAFIDVFEASKIAFIFWILMGTMIKIIDLESLNHKNIKNNE